MERTRGFTGHLDQGCICPTRIQPADRHHWHGYDSRGISHRLAFDHRGHAQLHQAERSARHLVGVPLSLADSNVLVWTAVDVPLRGLHHRDLWDRPALHVAADHPRRILVRIPHHSRLGDPERQAAHKCVNLTAIALCGHSDEPALLDIQPGRPHRRPYPWAEASCSMFISTRIILAQPG